MKKRNAVNDFTQTRLGDRQQSCARYNIGTNTLTKWAEQCGAVVRFGRAVRFDWTVLDADLERKRA